MKKRKINTNKINQSLPVIVAVFLLFVSFIARLTYLCLVDYQVGDQTITAFINNRNVETETLMPTRGSILDINGNVLAEDVASYTVIAYLDPKRSEGKDTAEHVTDPQTTAQTLAPYLDMTESKLYELLTKDAYQVELGPGGRNLSQLEMEKIRDLNLPGIDFIKNTKRYYPNGDFASYILGYTVNETDEENNIWKKGELGIEEYYNEELTGTSGYATYEKDRYGYTIANGRAYKEEAQDGSNIYLTIDNNIQLFIENALETVQAESEAEWTLMIVANAKTGEILGYSSTPSFDPNIKNITSYLDPIASNAYEPGSTMKIFSYMCAIESGNYKANETYLSGSKTYEENTPNEVTINDWKKQGWGELTYDQGFALSSNIAVANLLENTITKEELTACYTKYGFGKITGFPLKRETAGNITFQYQIEAAIAGYGQGITTTPIQHIQALTAIANDGKMLKPYLVDKIVNSNTNEITYEATTEVVDTVASYETVQKMKELMASVITPDSEHSTGYAYYMEDYQMIGKTGTAQIYDDKTGKYMTGEADYIYSFSGLYPKDEPEIIIYTAAKRPKDTTNYLAPAVKEVIVNISKYLNMETDEETVNNYELDNYLNQNVNIVKDNLEKNNLKVITLGTSGKIIKQYPESGYKVHTDDNIILVTNNYDNTMIDLTNMSYKEATTILSLININYEIEGTGYVYEQSIAKGEKFNSSDILTIKLKEKFLE